MREFIDGQPCGHSDANNQFNSFKAEQTNANGQFDSIFLGLKQYSLKANNALAVLEGTVMNMINDYNPVLTQLKLINNQTSYIFDKLRLTIAGNEWADLASYADSQF